MSPADATLLKRWVEFRDAEAFNDLVLRHADMVYATCRRVLGNAADAEEVAQECFLKLATSGERIRTSLGGWLHSVATSLAISRVRSDSRRHRREQARAVETAQAVEPCWDDLQQYVDTAIAELPAKLRDPLVQHFLQRKTHDEIAQDLGVSRSTITKRIADAIELVRASLRGRGIAVTAVVLTALVAENAAHAAPASLVTSLGRLAVSGVVKPGSGGVMSMLALAKIAAVLVSIAGIGVLASHYFPHDNGAAVPVQQADLASDSQPGPGTNVDKPARTTAVQTPASGVAASPTAPGVPADYSIRGRVYDAKTGEGIAGVRVQAYPSGGGTIKGESERTGPSGDYTIPRLDNGAYSVSLTEIPEYPDVRRSQGVTISVKEGEPVDGVDFALEKGIRVTGKVLDANQKPVVAEVGAKTATVPNPQRAKSNKDGVFAVYLPEAADDLMIQAQTDTFESVTQADLVLTKDGLNDLLLVLDQPRTATISGRVLDRDGAGVDGAQLHLLHTSGTRVFGYGRDGRASRDGRFQIENCEAGEFALTVTPKGVIGYSSAEENMRFTLASGQKLEGLEIVYGEKGGLAIAGHVLDGAGKPIAGARVQCFGDGIESAHTSADGAFIITGLKETEYSVGVEHTDYSRAFKRIQAGTLDAEVVLRGQGSLNGRVVRADTGAPLTEYTLAYLMGEAQCFDDQVYSSGRQVKSTDGAFHFDKVQAGSVTVAAWAPGFGPMWRVVPVEENAAAAIELALSSVPRFDGVVVDESGKPLAGAGVYFVERVMSSDLLDRVFAARTDAAGRFSLDSLPLEAEHICAQYAGYGIGVTERNGDHRIVLPVQSVVEGAVVLEGTVSSDINVYTRYPSAPYLPASYTRPNADGTFRLTGLAPGELNVSASPNSGVRHTVAKTVQLGKGQTVHLEFRFEKGTGVLEGKIDVAGAPVAQASVRLERRLSDRTDSIDGRPDATGAYRFEGVWPGSLTLVVTRVDMAHPFDPIRDEITISLGEGETLRQDIHLNPAP